MLPALALVAGFALLTCGLVRQKNGAHLAMLSLAAYVFALLAYDVVGYALQYGGASTTGRFLVGRGGWGLMGASQFLAGASDGLGGSGISAIDLAFALVPPLIIVGAVCERITFWAFVVCVLIIAGLVYPIFGCWVWGGGWLAQTGFTLHLGHGYIDAAGSSVVHEVGGFAAMALAIILGPRLGKYGMDGRPRPFPAHNIVFVVVGAVMIAAGWSSVSAGPVLRSTPVATLALLNTNLAAVSGAAAAMVFWHTSYGKPDISMACTGLLGGIAAVSGGAIFFGPAVAILIGGLAGLLASAGVLFNERVLKVDDPCGSVAAHGYCGWLGAVAVGLFANGRTAGVTGLFYGDVRQFGAQLGGATLCAVYAFGVSYVIFKAIDASRSMRVEPEVELEGLDLHEFGMLAYTDDDTLAG